MKYNEKTLQNVKVLDVTLLTKEEVEKYDELIDPTDTPWWLFSEDPNKVYYVHQSLDRFGFLYSHLERNRRIHVYDEIYRLSVLNKEYGVRPAFRLSNLEKNSIMPGDIIDFYKHTLRVLSSDLAVFTDSVALKPYRKDFEAKNALDYEASDVKEYLKVWYRKYKWLDENYSKIEEAKENFRKEEHLEIKHFSHIYGAISDEIGKRSYKIKDSYDSGWGEKTVGYHEVVDVKDLKLAVLTILDDIEEELFRSKNKELFKDAEDILSIS